MATTTTTTVEDAGGIKKVTEETSKKSEGKARDICIIDLGEHSRTRVKKLRRGEGRLMRKVEDAIGDLEEQGLLEASAQTVVIIVRQEPDVVGLFGMRDDDDDDDD